MIQERIDTLKESVKKAEFQGHILETLIYFASDRGKKKLPTREEFILSEVVAATIEYLTGKEYLFTYCRIEDGKEYLNREPGWEWKTNEVMAESLEQFGDKLNTPFKEALKKLTEIKTSFDEWNDIGYDSWLYTWYKLNICHTLMTSTFSLSVDFVEKVKKEVIPSLDPDTIHHCKAIARLMKKYIEKDIKLGERIWYWQTN